MCFNPIESVTALSDNDDKEPQEFLLFCQATEMDFQHLTGPKNVSVDLKYDVLCL